ncbi:MAG: hypothetical protein H0W74_07265 [Sphingosinicella sp.]|nr:hypothetical protein [Sphingosinicella sp.]
MTAAAAATSRTSGGNGWGLPILAGGLAAGALDISYAVLMTLSAGRDPAAMLRAISGGLFGLEAFQGGALMSVAGLALHFAMTLMMAAIFAAAIRAGLRSLRDYPLLSGPLYGAGVYLVMQQVVLPLSRLPLPDPRAPINFLDLAVHMFLVGLPIALAAHALAPKRS